MHWLFLSCLKATELIEKKMSFRLSSKEKMQLMMHKAMCEACSRYEKQSQLIDEVISGQAPKTPSEGEVNLLKQKILSDLDVAQK